MPMNDHTPGPWSVEDNAIMADVGAYIATVSTAGDFPCLDQDEETQEHVKAECAANARLIAAAPELLKYLASFVRLSDEKIKNPEMAWPTWETPLLIEARAAIAKAEGGR